MRSVMPFTAFLRTSLAMENDSRSGVPRSATSPILSLGITMRVSTYSASSSIPCSAFRLLLPPS